MQTDAEILQAPRRHAAEARLGTSSVSIPTARRAPVRVMMYVKYLPPRYSGAGQQALTLAGALRERGVSCELLTEATADRASLHKIDGFPVHAFYPATDNCSIQPRRCLAFAQLARRRRIPGRTIFHAHTAYPEASALGITARMLGIPSVLKVTLHASDANVASSRFIGRLHHQLLKRQNAIVAISRDIEAELQALQIKPARTVAIPNGVDTERFRPADVRIKSSARQRLGLPPIPTPVVLFAGVVDERKNVGALLDAWMAHRREGGGGVLAMAGPVSRSPQDALRRRVEGLAQQDSANVRWLGRVAEMEDVYAAADLFVLPAKSEGMPNVVLEAMAAGLPVAVSAVSGTCDILGPEAAGIVFDADDTRALKHAIAVPDTDPERLAHLAGAARRRVEDTFSIRSVARRYERLYRRLLYARPRVRKP